MKSQPEFKGCGIIYTLPDSQWRASDQKGNGGWGIQPRTAIGQTIDGKVLMLVIDGRQVGSIGATLKNVQDIMLEHGAYNAANLDGGSSTVMYYQGELLNKPCSIKGERLLPDAFVVK
jgi:exopolysaccharide biosynthesis protein